MNLETEPDARKLVAQIIHHHHSRWRHLQQWSRRNERDHASMLRLLRCDGDLDAASLPARHLQKPITLQFLQRGTQRVAAHLQPRAQLTLSRQVALPVPCLHGFTHALRRQGNK